MTIDMRSSTAQRKMIEGHRENSAYLGESLVYGSRPTSVINEQIRRSFRTASRKLHTSNARVRFYTPDHSNTGAMYAVSPQQFTNFDLSFSSLISAPLLTKKPEGDNFIFSMYSADTITSLEDLRPEDTYICSTYQLAEQIVSMDRLHTPTMGKAMLPSLALTANQDVRRGRDLKNMVSHADDKQQEEVTDEALFIRELKPRLISVVKAGHKPRKSVRVHLNRKTTISFEQVVRGISDIISPGERIKKIYSASGRLVLCLADFYMSDSVFIAYTSSERMHTDDLVLDPPEVQLVGAYRFRNIGRIGRVTLTSHPGCSPQAIHSSECVPRVDHPRQSASSKLTHSSKTISAEHRELLKPNHAADGKGVEMENQQLDGLMQGGAIKTSDQQPAVEPQLKRWTSHDGEMDRFDGRLSSGNESDHANVHKHHENSPLPPQKSPIPLREKVFEKNKQIHDKPSHPPKDKAILKQAESPTLPADSTSLPADNVAIAVESTPLPEDSAPLPEDNIAIPVESVPLPADSAPLPADSAPLPAPGTPVSDKYSPSPLLTMPAVVNSTVSEPEHGEDTESNV